MNNMNLHSESMNVGNVDSRPADRYVSPLAIHLAIRLPSSKTFIHSRVTQGYTKPREYIVTEWPLRHTCGEFWSLVYDYECAAVVVLCVPPQGSANFPSFWPEGRHSKKYGPVFTIDHISHNHYTNIKTWVRSQSADRRGVRIAANYRS